MAQDRHWEYIGPAWELPDWMCIGVEGCFDYYLYNPMGNIFFEQKIGISRRHNEYRQVRTNRVVPVLPVELNLGVGRVEIKEFRVVIMEWEFGGSDCDPPLDTHPVYTHLPNGMISIHRRIELPWQPLGHPNDRFVIIPDQVPG